ncbi:hypothetical protein XcvCFBP7113P_07550 [Xanthomonas citri pv. vignicola]|nr:hypothetical protein XcvCFBP7113P_07550 [Xanthomonas citri pv. vignicola]
MGDRGSGIGDRGSGIGEWGVGSGIGIGESKNKGVVASLLESLSASQRAPPQNAAPPLPIPNTESRIPTPDSPPH